MDYVKEIELLRETIKKDEECEKHEMCLREIRREILLKRDQVVHLERELTEANTKIFDLNRELESNKTLLSKTEFRLKLAIKKSAMLEDKLKEMTESQTAIKLEEELRLSEIEILNKNMQKLARENHLLSREVEETKDKLKYSAAFQKELEERQMKINGIIRKCKENCDGLEKQHKKVAEMGEKLDKGESFRNLSEVLRDQNKKLKEEKITLENSLLQCSAKLDKLSKLLERHKDPVYESLIEKIKVLHWESHCKKLQEKNSQSEKVLTSLTSTLNNEIEANALLLLKIDQYESRIKDLENKLDQKGIKEEKITVD